ncbi:MAG: hypothetical protein M1840_002258 [Geoglossum simile]|nr:MAG: hypothetical protein M1840_002258 [Geoglossum simile]
MNLYWKLKTYLEKTVSEEHVDLRHEWRVATARIMAARGSSSMQRALGEAVRERALELRGDLQTFSTGDLDASSKTMMKLEDLIQDAVDLDIIFEQQLPHFFFYPVLPENPENWGLVFSNNSMVVACDDGKVPLPDRHQQVKLVLTPGLWKHGTSAGRNYEQRSIISKAEVEITSGSGY